MNIAGNERITQRKVRPIHYIAVAALILICGIVAATFGAQTVSRFSRMAMVGTCALVGLYSLRFGVLAYRLEFARAGLGLIERDKQPIAFWMLLLFTVLIGPILEGFCLLITRGW